ncbi:MAG: GNAT family N-acetyltransferase [Gammaproteobacteria bacterium]|nr:GNAT family N-acetyltransferase [Gammaproteobacteria bacterium]
MFAWLQSCERSSRFRFYAVKLNDTQRAIGMVNFCNVVEKMGRLEVDFIWYQAEYQQTYVNTESVYLLLPGAFENMDYRRVEWKCGARNARSRTAALRLGFSSEGVFRKHMI